MRRTCASVALLLVVAACGGSTTSSSSSATSTTAAPAATTTVAPTTSAPPTTEAPPAEGRLELFSATFTAFAANIHNATADTIDLTGYHLCQGDTCAEIPSIEMPSGSYLSINTGSQVFLPIPGSLTVDGIVSVGAFDPADGELALYMGDASGTLVSYVEWGSSGHTHSAAAVAAGVWQEGWFVETTADTVAITYQPDTSTADEAGWNAY